MAKKLEFEATMSTSKFAAGAASLERIAKQSNERLAQTRTDYNSPDVVAMLKQATINKRNRDAETAAILKTQQERKTKLDSMVGQSAFTTGGISPLEQQQKGLRRFAGGYAQLLHTVRATADSLASGQDPIRVLMQQAPQALQALLQMRLGMVALGVAAAAVGIGIAAYFVKSMVDSYTGADKLGAILQRTARMADNLRIKMEELALAKQLALKGDIGDAKRAKDAADYDKIARDAALSLAEEEMRANYLSEKKVHTKADELALEKAILKIKEEQAWLDLDAAEKKLNEAIAVAEAKSNLNQLEMEMATVEKDREAQRKIASSVLVAYGDTPEKAAARKEIESANNKIAELNEDIRSAKLDLEEAKRRNGQAEVDKAKAALLHIQNALNTPDAVTAARSSRGSLSTGGDSLVRVGNFMGSTGGKIESLAQKHAELLQNWLPKIEANTRRGGNTGFYPQN